MLYINLLNSIDSSKTSIWQSTLSKCSGSFKLALPGILIITCHIVVSMVTGNNHQRTKNNFLVSCFLYLLDNLVTRLYLPAYPLPYR